MATLEDAIYKGYLEVVPLPDWEARQPIRMLYATPTFLDQIEQDQKLHDEKLSEGGLTLYEHLWQRMSDFRCSNVAGCGDLLRVMPSRKRVWKLHSNGLRIFGWAPAPHSLALVCYELASVTHTTKGLADKLREEVITFVQEHQLLGTMQKGDYLAVFSNKQS